MNLGAGSRMIRLPEIERAWRAGEGADVAVKTHRRTIDRKLGVTNRRKDRTRRRAEPSLETRARRIILDEHGLCAFQGARVPPSVGPASAVRTQRRYEWFDYGGGR